MSRMLLLFPKKCWEEVVASGLNYINCTGALRKHKNGNITDVNTVGVTPFDFSRLKRHLHGVLDRISYINTGVDMSDVKSDDLHKNQSVQEEEEGNVMEGDAQIENGGCIETGSDNKRELKNTSEWVYDVEKMVNILPKLAHMNNEAND